MTSLRPPFNVALMSAFFAFLSALSYGIGDFSGGLAARKTPALTVVIWSQTAGLICAAGILVFMDSTPLTFSGFLWGAAAGLAGASGLALLYKGLAVGLASVVSPSAALTGAVLPVLFGLITGERPPLMVWLGMALAIPAIFLLSLEPPEAEKNVKTSLGYGVLAGLSFGGFFILISRAGSTSGFWPLLSARSASIPVFLIIAAIRGQPLRVEDKSRFPVLATGVLDMTANVFYMMAARSGMLISAAIMTSLYPAPTVLLQWLAFGEKPGKSKVAGLLLTIAGMILISTGS